MSIGFSRLDADTFALGNGTPGDFSGNLKLNKLTANSVETALDTVVANTTLTAAHSTVVADGPSLLITLPDPALFAKTKYVIKNINATLATIVATVDNLVNPTLVQWAAISVQSDGTSWLIID